MTEWQGLPGAEMVEQGVRELNSDRRTPEALLVATAWTRLHDLGAPLGRRLDPPAEPDLDLYQSLEGICDDPYSRYNAMRRELDSFIAALEHRRTRAARSAKIEI